MYPDSLPTDLPSDIPFDILADLKSTDPFIRRFAAIRWAEQSFEGFVRFLYPKRTIAPFQLDFIRMLDLLEKRTLIHPITLKPVYNLLTNFPPRHAKTHYGTVLFAAYLMGRNTKRKTMVSAYNATLATDFGKETRAITMMPEFATVFPLFQISADTRAGDEWKTTARGAYYAVGLDGPTSGRPANCLIIDDPIKNRVEANSAAVRKSVWDFIVSALWYRLEPEEDGTPPIQIMTLTRWHPDDPAGRLQALPEWSEGEWMHVYYQGLTELPPLPDGTKQYKALWPERFPVEYLLRQKSRSERDFAALYQQQPQVEGGNIVKTNWWQWLPSDFDFKGQHYHSVLIAADTAFKERTVNDYSAIAIGGITNKGEIHIFQIVRARLAFPDLKAKLMQLNALWRPKGLRGIIVEDKASGQSLVQELRRESGISIIPRVWPGDKVTHLSAILPLIEGGRVYLPSNGIANMNTAWVDDFLTEIGQFPSGAFDDQVDAVTLLIHELAKASITPEMMIDQFNAFTPLAPGSKKMEGLYGKSINETLALSTFKSWGD